jgi:cell division protein FtsB
MGRWLFHPLTALSLTLLTLVMVISLRQTAQKTQISSEETMVLDQEVQKIASEISQLQEQVELAEHPFTQEKILRNELLLQKPGEYVVQLPEVSVPPQPQPTPSPSLTPWQAWQKVLLQ